MPPLSRARAPTRPPTSSRPQRTETDLSTSSPALTPPVLVAEVIAHFYPRLVELHNYSSANAMTQKVYNWQTLNSRALKKLGFQIPREEFMDVCNCRAGAIERVLKLCKFKMAEFQRKHGVAGKGPAGGQTQANGAVDAAAAGAASGGGGGAGAAAGEGANGAGVPHGIPHAFNCQNCGYANVVFGAGEAGARADESVAPPGILKTPGLTRETDGEGGEFIAAGAPAGAPAEAAVIQQGVDPGLVKQKDVIIAELRETNSILEAKSRKLEQLVRLKDAKIQTLLNKLQALGALRPAE